MTDPKKTDSIKSISQIGISDVVGTGVVAFFWFYLATLLDVETYGELHYFIAIASFAYIISMIGTRDVVTVYVSKKIKIAPTLFLLSLSVGIVAAIVIFGIYYRIDAAFLVLAFIINDLAIGYILGQKLFNSYAKYILTQKSLTILLGFGFYFILGPEGIIFALALSYIHFLILIYKGLKTSPINFSTLKPRAGFIINNYAYSTLGGLRANIDKLIIAPLLGFALLGNLVLAMQFYVILQIIPSLVFKYTLTHDASGIPTTKVKLWTMVFAIVSCIGTIVLSPYIIPGFFPKFAEVVIAIQILSVCIIPDTLANIFYTSKFLGQEKSKNPLIATVIMVILTALGIIILGPIYGILGVSFSFVLASFGQFTYLFFVNRALKTS